MKIKMISMPDEIHARLLKEDNASGLIVELLSHYYKSKNQPERSIEEMEAELVRLQKKKELLNELKVLDGN